MEEEDKGIYFDRFHHYEYENEFIRENAERASEEESYESVNMFIRRVFKRRHSSGVKKISLIAESIFNFCTNCPIILNDPFLLYRVPNNILARCYGKGCLYYYDPFTRKDTDSGIGVSYSWGILQLLNEVYISHDATIDKVNYTEKKLIKLNNLLYERNDYMSLIALNFNFLLAIAGESTKKLCETYTISKNECKHFPPLTYPEYIPSGILFNYRDVYVFGKGIQRINLGSHAEWEIIKTSSKIADSSNGLQINSKNLLIITRPSNGDRTEVYTFDTRDNSAYIASRNNAVYDGVYQKNSPVVIGNKIYFMGYVKVTSVTIKGYYIMMEKYNP